jgi:hypothetical protein
MPFAESRITPRYKIETPFTFRRIELPSEGVRQAKALDISTRGVYFTTNLAMRVGETVELLLRMPRQVRGADSTLRRFVGRVTHIDARADLQGHSGVGIHLLYWERYSSNSAVSGN